MAIKPNAPAISATAITVLPKGKVLLACRWPLRRAQDPRHRDRLPCAASRSFVPARSRRQRTTPAGPPAGGLEGLRQPRGPPVPHVRSAPALGAFLVAPMSSNCRAAVGTLGKPWGRPPPAQKACLPIPFGANVGPCPTSKEGPSLRRFPCCYSAFEGGVAPEIFGCRERRSKGLSIGVQF